MTIGTKMQQTIASCESVKANLDSFALETQDQQAKQMFQQLSQSTQSILTTLQSRLNYIQEQEPQYKS
jgi:hypothetical protein